MIARSVAVRQGRRTLATPLPRSIVRQITTDTNPGVQTADQSQIEKSFQAPEAHHNRWKQVSSARKKQKALRDRISMLGVDSAHEHRSLAWTRSVKNDATGEVVLSPSERFAEFQRIQNHTRNLGSHVDRRYSPTQLLANPPGPRDVTLELLMASQTHMGHHKSLWNPANARSIYGVRHGIHIISLETTAAHLRRAARVVEDVAYHGGLILFVGNRKGQMEIVTKAAEMAGACHLFTKWTPGGITNRDVILAQQTVKVVDQKDKDLDGFETYKNAMRPLMPDLVVCLNPMENYTLLYECGLKDIPTIGVIDTNADPTWVTYTIPANDDSLRSIAVIAGVLGRAGEAGQKRRREVSSKGQVPWETSGAITRHMLNEVDKAIKKRKEVMGKLQQNVMGFNEEEEQILLSAKQASPTFEVGEGDMMDMLKEAMAGEVEADAKTDAAEVTLAEVVAETIPTTSLDHIEAGLEAARQQAADIEAAVAESLAAQAKESQSESKTKE
ncbi:ribosomal protein S2, flavodoxin-like domain-containing protein [Stachybotrys elegans]|uniref:Ribosomal protein S2, flavodoxin-like domain-containing protein n=1 Tax=Stachybotrys elegans TaxID=80388 RepID=A0A8K0T008_9HYPO|nr:ribosomal protein S2, flavodoxin-like domain-containing protein [Stachybotrys elegans]